MDSGSNLDEHQPSLLETGIIGDEPLHNPEVKEWLEKYPTVEDGLKTSFDEKKKFILSYYSEDVDSERLLENMLEEAEKILDKEIAAGHNKPPFSEHIALAMMAIAKGKVMDELIEDVTKVYQDRRKLVQGKEIKDPGVIKVTQINCSKLAYLIQTKILKQVEEEAKSRDFPIEEFMYLCAMMAGNDMQTFVEVERIYNHRKTEENKDKEFDREKVKQYIQESLKISEQILSGEIDSSVVFLFPHLLSDKLFNVTGYESEEVVYYIRKMVAENTIEAELVDLIVKEAYSVEKSRENCQTTFDNQMMTYQRQMQEAYLRRMQEVQNIKDPLDDPAIKKMIQTGMLSREDAEQMINKRVNSQGYQRPNN